MRAASDALGNDARQAEDREGRIVRVDRHAHADFFRHRHDFAQEGDEVFAQTVRRHRGSGRGRGGNSRGRR
jgi:hypothetical protein